MALLNDGYIHKMKVLRHWTCAGRVPPSLKYEAKMLFLFWSVAIVILYVPSAHNSQAVQTYFTTVAQVTSVFWFSHLTL